jgi:hypothetical protein
MHLSPLTLLATLATATNAQNAPIAPSMTLLYSMAADLGDRFSLGPVPTGQERFVIPIVGGTFKGPRLSGSQIHPPIPQQFFDNYRQGAQPWRRLAPRRRAGQCATGYALQHPN